MIAALLLSTLAAAALWLGGLRVGAARATRALAEDAARHHTEETARHRAALAAAEGAAARGRIEAERLGHELEAAVARIRHAEHRAALAEHAVVQHAQAAAAQRATPEGAQDAHAVGAELARLLRPMVEQQDARLRHMVTEALRPVVEAERLGLALARIEAGTARGDLERLLDAIAHEGGFAAVVLADDSGLLLAHDAGARAPEARAGVAALFANVADRWQAAQLARPQAAVFLDEAHQHVLTRLFTLEDARFLLTAVSGRALSPAALDPALDKIARLMGDWTQIGTESPRAANG